MGRKLVKVVILGVFALAVGLYFNGCAAKKKLVSKIKVEVVKPTPAEKAKIEEQAIAAIKGESIPLAESLKGRVFKGPGSELSGIFANIHFDFDRAEIKPEARVILNRVASWLKENTNAYLMVEGHCDERGTEEYNLALGERRALSARRYLIGLEVSSGRLHTVSYGEAAPLDPGHNEEAWTKNRRVHFLISR